MASSLYYIKTPLSGAACVFGCLDDVWKESENVWGCISTKSVGKQIISGQDTQILAFIPLSCIA